MAPVSYTHLYLEERAEGQTALIIQTICPWKRNDIDPDHIHELPSCYDESCIPDLQRYMICLLSTSRCV